MANSLQKTIYYLSAVSPLLLFFSLAWYIQKKSLTIPIICIIIAIILIICFYRSFSYGSKHLAPIQISTSEVTPIDNRLFIYITTYILPFASIVIDDFDVVICGVIIIVLVILTLFVNTAIPNPLLAILKYHFYSVKAENGISGYVLITKRQIRKKQDVKVVYRIFEFLLLDKGV